MRKNTSKLANKKVIVEPPPTVNEKEAEWWREYEENLAKLHSEMFTWLTHSRRSYRYNGDNGENS